MTELRERPKRTLEIALIVWALAGICMLLAAWLAGW